MAIHNLTGKKGELIACQFLKNKSYNILETNWRCKKYELDIIATDHKEIIIVEVKTRTDSNYENAKMAITNKKIRNIIKATEAYIKKHNISLPVRFDIICIITDGKKFRLQHIKDAFSSPVW